MRYNTFNQIHKALRALLYETALLVQQTDFVNQHEAYLALQKITEAVDIFDRHAEHEDKFVLPAIAEYEPALVDSFEQEHEEDHRLAEELRKLVKDFAKCNDDAARVNAGLSLLHSFVAFMNFNLAHMAKEEKVLNEKLWKYYSDREILAINQKIVASIPDDEMNFTATWMMKGMSNTEISGWLRAVQGSAPEFVFKNLFALAERELPNQRFRKILEDLTEGAMVA